MYITPIFLHTPSTLNKTSTQVHTTTVKKTKKQELSIWKQGQRHRCTISGNVHTLNTFQRDVVKDELRS